MSLGKDKGPEVVEHVRTFQNTHNDMEVNAPLCHRAYRQSSGRSLPLRACTGSILRSKPPKKECQHDNFSTPQSSACEAVRPIPAWPARRRMPPLAFASQSLNPS